MRTSFFYIPGILIALFLPVRCAAQTQDPDFQRLEQMMQRMQEQMRRSMNFDSTFDGGRLQISPDSNSFFYYHVDTSFNGMDSEFFNFSPFGSPGQSDFLDFNQLFDQFFRGADPRAPRRGQGEFPSDDGQSSGADGLLPEERLRLQEEKAKPGEQPEKAPKPKVKTIRI